MLKCKCCHKSDFGVNLIKTTKDPVRLLNGEITKVLGEQEVIEEIEYCFCNTCKKPITKDDLYEQVECPVCNRKVNELVNGKCPACDRVSSEMESFSKDDLIRILIKQQMQLEIISNKVEEISNSKSNEVKTQNSKPQDNKIKDAKNEVIKKKEIPSDISKLKVDEDDDILSRIENLEIEGLDLEDDEVEID